MIIFKNRKSPVSVPDRIAINYQRVCKFMFKPLNFASNHYAAHRVYIEAVSGIYCMAHFKVLICIRRLMDINSLF